jgi:hypothetical protein
VFRNKYFVRRDYSLKAVDFFLVNKTVSYYKRRKIGTKKALSRSRINIRNKSMSTPCPFNAIFQENKRSLKLYRSLYEFLRVETERNFSEIPESKLASIRSYLCSSDIPNKLSLVDKGLLVDLISSGDKCGLFSADLQMVGTYYEAVRRFSLSDCFVCDGVHSKTDWLK